MVDSHVVVLLLFYIVLTIPMLVTLALILRRRTQQPIKVRGKQCTTTATRNAHATVGTDPALRPKRIRRPHDAVAEKEQRKVSGRMCECAVGASLRVGQADRQTDHTATMRSAQRRGTGETSVARGDCGWGRT